LSSRSCSILKDKATALRPLPPPPPQPAVFLLVAATTAEKSKKSDDKDEVSEFPNFAIGLQCFLNVILGRFVKFGGILCNALLTIASMQVLFVPERERKRERESLRKREEPTIVKIKERDR
jgi:hypothetical protein